MTYRTEVYYEHDQGWYSRPINSHNFHERHGHENPDNRWPYFGDSWHARRLDMENMKLDINRALDKLGKNSRSISLGLFEETAAYETEDKFKRNGFAKLEHRGCYLYTSTKRNNPTSTHIGQMRIGFGHSPCGTATVMAQHM